MRTNLCPATKVITRLACSALLECPFDLGGPRILGEWVLTISANFRCSYLADGHAHLHSRSNSNNNSCNGYSNRRRGDEAAAGATNSWNCTTSCLGVNAIQFSNCILDGPNNSNNNYSCKWSRMKRCPARRSKVRLYNLPFLLLLWLKNMVNGI